MNLFSLFLSLINFVLIVGFTYTRNKKNKLLKEDCRLLEVECRNLRIENISLRSKLNKAKRGLFMNDK